MDTNTNIRKRYLWLAVLIVYLTILSTLFIGQPLANELRDQNVQAVFFLFGMFMVGIAVLLHGLISKPSKIEYAVLFGIIGVYVMFFFRLGAPERSHLIEYSALAILLHKAIRREIAPERSIWLPAILAWLSGIFLGTLDEGIQYFLPERVFDPVDIVFNSMAISMAIIATMLLNWLNKKFTKRKVN
ncbi:VanZ family protein [Muriicola soli]|uniref:VanZ family protein n=1 Tax=Muriicola soli TaxID=2507538 RepID=A0A411EB59_9FLAO|nr:VanZ family protein [Muriicola soli]QBA64965.1 VanZ family protein [Muriicola soli]